MAKWESTGDVYVESVEEILDTNPDLYKQRTIVALNEKRYKDALKEANLALQYGKEALQYRVLKARVLFEKQDYSGCMRYLKESQLWNKKEDNELLKEEKVFISYIYAVCYRECSYPMNKVDWILITPDGKGMYSTIQQAVSNCKKNQGILLLAGMYHQVGERCEFSSSTGEFSGTDVYIENKNLSIKSAEGVTINCRLIVKNSKVKIENSKFIVGNLKVQNQDIGIIEVKNSEIVLDNVQVSAKYFESNKTILGLEIDDYSNIFVNHSIFLNLGVGIGVEKGKARIDTCKFQNCAMGVGVKSEGVLHKRNEAHILNSEFKDLHQNEIGFAIMLIGAGYIEVSHCKLDNNNAGIVIAKSDDSGKAGKINVMDSGIYYNKAGAIVKDGGSLSMKNCVISGSSKSAITLMDDVSLELIDSTLKNNKVEIDKTGNPIIREERVIRENNNPTASTLENTFNGVFRFITGKNLFE